MIDILQTRRDTPGVEQVLHLNNAGAALPLRPVLDAVIGHLELEGRIGGYEAAEQASAQLERTYGVIAQLLNCTPQEIALVENATRAWDMAFYSFAFQPGDRILTGAGEYASNYIAFLQMARRTGAVVEMIPSAPTGEISVAALEQMLDSRVKLIAITHVPTNGGLVNPVAAIGRVARAHGVPFLLDACQSAGQLSLDVKKIGCDILSATGRKYLRAPRGTGFLYVRQSLIEKIEPPFLDLRAATWTGRDQFQIRPDARRFETFEGNFAGKIGLGTAVEYALQLGMPAIQARITTLADALRERLALLPRVTIRDLGTERCGIVSFTVESIAATQIKSELKRQNINVSVSPVQFTRLDMEARGLTELVRASLHYYNDDAELTRFIEVLSQICRP